MTENKPCAYLSTNEAAAFLVGMCVNASVPHFQSPVGILMDVYIDGALKHLMGREVDDFTAEEIADICNRILHEVLKMRGVAK